MAFEVGQKVRAKSWPHRIRTVLWTDGEWFMYRAHDDPELSPVTEKVYGWEPIPEPPKFQFGDSVRVADDSEDGTTGILFYSYNDHAKVIVEGQHHPLVCSPKELTLISRHGEQDLSWMPEVDVLQDLINMHETNDSSWPFTIKFLRECIRRKEGENA